MAFDFDVVNHQWIQNGADVREIPDCGHEDCGSMCDPAILTERHARAVREDFRLAVAGSRLADHNAEVGAIKRLLAAGLTLRQISYHLGHPLRDVIDLLLRKHADLSEAREFLDAELLLRRGYTALHVAEATDLSPTTILLLRRWIQG